MKILLLAPASSIHTIRWANAFSDRGHEVLLVSLPNHQLKEATLPQKVALKYLSVSGGKGYYLNAKELKRISRAFRPDVINTHFASGYGTLARVAGIHPVVLNVWGRDIFAFPREGYIQKKILIKNIRNADGVASTSQCMANEVKSILEDSSLDITITPFGVNTALFRPFESELRDPNKFVFGTVKSLTYVYGINYLIEAFSIFLEKWKKEGQQGPTPYYFICGNGENKQDFIDLRNKLGLENWIEIEDYVPHGELPKYINSFDVSCFASLHESFGVSVIESMACEVPVIATDTDGFREVMEDGETGYIVEKENAEAIAEKMWYLYNNELERLRLGKNGRKRVLELYDWNNSVDTLVSLLIDKARSIGDER